MRPKSEQEIWNEEAANRKLRLAPKSNLKKLLNEVKKPESDPPKSYDPIANAMERFPGLTREEAEEIALAFGF